MSLSSVLSARLGDHGDRRVPRYERDQRDRGSGRGLSAPAPRSRRLSVVMAAAAALALVVGSFASPGPVDPAAADTAPVIAGEPATVSSDALPTVQINGVVWAQVVVGNVVYVGGNFTNARPAGAAAGVNTVSRTHLLAYDITTGALIASFAPTLNNQVRTLAVSPDGRRLYVGGNFTTINGVSRNRIAAFDVATGTLVSGFNPNANSNVNAVVASNSTVWIGGAFTAVSGQTRNGAAAVAASNAALQPWAPVLAGGRANGMALSPDQSRIVIGGSFTSLNGASDPGYGIGMVESTGPAKTNLPFRANSVVRNGGLNGAITSLASDGSGVYASGYDYGAGANFEGTFRASWADGTIGWLEDCHGDTHSVFPMGGIAYKAGHAHNCNGIGGFPEVTPRVEYRAMAVTNAAAGTVRRNTVPNYVNFEGNPAPREVNWFPAINSGTFTGANQGPWNVAGDARYIVYGGEFTRVNNVPQQGLVRFAVKDIAPNKDGPRAAGSAWVPTAAPGAGSITVTWPANHDRDNERLTYRVYRAGTAAPVGEVTAASRFYKRPSLSFTNAGLTGGQTYSYSVRAIDPFGNTVTSASVSATAGAGGTPAPPPPGPAGGALASDDFGRTVSSGWGSASAGGAWTLSGAAANFAVAGGTGRMTVPAAGQTLSAALRSVSSATTDLTVRTSLAQAVSGGPVYVSFIGRAVSGNDYRARLVYATNGSVNLQLQRSGTTLQAVTLPGITYVAGEVLQVRLQVSGTAPTTIRARVWRVGSAEPTGWTLSATDATAALQAPGSIGLSSYLSGSSTGLPRTVTFDDVAATTAQ